MKLLILVAAALLLLPAPAGAQGYNPPGTIVVTPARPVSPGELVRVTVTNCDPPPGGVVTVFIDGIDVGTATVGPGGGFSEEFAVPLEAEGDVTVSVQCDNGLLSTIITVVLPDLPFQDDDPDDPDVGDRGGDNLPRTGLSSTKPLARIGVGLMAFGALLVFIVSRRREERWEPQHA